MKKLFTLFFLLAFTGQSYSQCTNHVTNITGTSVVNGISITVDSFAYADVFTTYCVNTTPYFIGYKFSSGQSGTGGYTFTFSPAVSSLTLNFSGASNLVTTDQEIIKLFVNGSHYAIPSVGTPNGCDAMAILTPSGDLTGCLNCGVSGWDGTTIPGPISTLTVLDTLQIGPSSGGTLFSLFICGAAGSLPPVADFQSNKTTICVNDCIDFTDLSTNATSWKWKFDGAVDSTSTAQNPQTVCYQSAGTYNVTLIASNSGGSDTATFTSYIHVMPAPPTPVITQVGSTLYCSTNPNYTSYQWYDSTALIPGATDTLLTVTHSGNYNVQVSNEDGCKIAVGINVVLTGINYLATDNGMSLFPNPATDQLTIQYAFERNKSLQLSIMNVLGQETSPPFILTPNPSPAISGTGPLGEGSASIDVSRLEAGMYFVQMKTEKGRIVKKFIKE